jgi:hypothetical protein
LSALALNGLRYLLFGAFLNPNTVRYDEELREDWPQFSPFSGRCLDDGGKARVIVWERAPASPVCREQ